MANIALWQLWGHSGEEPASSSPGSATHCQCGVSTPPFPCSWDSDANIPSVLSELEERGIQQWHTHGAWLSGPPAVTNDGWERGTEPWAGVYTGFVTLTVKL